MPEELQTGEIDGVADQSPELENESGETELSPPDNEEGELQSSPEEYANEISGLKSAVSAERERRRNAEAEAAAFRAQQSQRPEEEPIEDDDYYTAGMVNKLIDQKVREQLGHGYNSLVSTQEEMMRMKHNDYDEVIEFAKRLAEDDPGVLIGIQNSRKPAVTAYNLGRSHPDYQKSQTRKTTKGLTTKIKETSKKTPTLSDTGASGTTQHDATKRISDMSSQDVETELARILSSS